MKVDRISYKKIFPIGSYINETIGVEVQLDDKDDFHETFQYAKELVEKFHKENNPQLTDAETQKWEIRPPHAFAAPLPTLDRSLIDRIEKLIDDAEIEEGLASLYPEVEKINNGELFRQYYVKLSQLQKQ